MEDILRRYAQLPAVVSDIRDYEGLLTEKTLPGPLSGLLKPLSGHEACDMGLPDIQIRVMEKGRNDKAT